MRSVRQCVTGTDTACQCEQRALSSTCVNFNTPPLTQIAILMHRTDLRTCAPGLRDLFTHAAKVEVASNCANHGGVLAANVTCSGGLFPWTFFLRHCDVRCPVLPQFQHVLVVPAPLPPLPFWPPPLALGCGVPHTRQMTDFFHIFDTSCRSEGSLQKCHQCFRILDIACGVSLSRLLPPFVPLPPLLGVPLLVAPMSIGVGCV